MIKFFAGVVLGAAVCWGFMHQAEVNKGVARAQKVTSAVQGALSDAK